MVEVGKDGTLVLSANTATENFPHSLIPRYAYTSYW